MPTAAGEAMAAKAAAVEATAAKPAAVEATAAKAAAVETTAATAATRAEPGRRRRNGGQPERKRRDRRHYCFRDTHWNSPDGSEPVRPVTHSSRFRFPIESANIAAPMRDGILPLN
jgi:hypothetical protein